MSEKYANITFIVPVYNCEKYILRCLDSIYSQEISIKIEVIVVDDASTDNSLMLLKEYKLNKPSLKIIEHFTNKSLAISRIDGIKAATGNYILHVDADDWLLDGSIEKMHNKIVETHSDVLVFNYITENSEGKRTFVNLIKKIIYTNDKDKAHPYFLATAWNKLVKRSLTQNLIYGNVSINSAEDLLYATEIILKANKICITPETYYVYFKNTKSLTFVTKPDTFLNSQIIVIEQIRLITLNYKATSKFTKNILSHIEKHVFFAIAQSNLIFKDGKPQYIDLINAFRLFPEMSLKRLNMLSFSISSKYFSLIPVLFKFGIKPVIVFILKSTWNYFFKNQLNKVI